MDESSYIKLVSIERQEKPDKKNQKHSRDVTVEHTYVYDGVSFHLHLVMQTINHWLGYRHALGTSGGA